MNDIKSESVAIPICSRFGKPSAKLRFQLRLHLSLLVSVAGRALSTLGGQALPRPEMTFLDDGQVRIGMDLALGGAVTFISSKEAYFKCQRMA